MAEGVLNLALGLETGGFTGALGKAGEATGLFGKALAEGTEELTKMLTPLKLAEDAAELLKAAMEATWRAVEQGAALEHLSKRTQTSVADLYKLQAGFKAVGLSGDDVGPMIAKLQEALSGVNEQGEDTRAVFASLGLNLGALKNMDAARQFQAIGVALNQLGGAGAASAAGILFGHDSAASMLQLAGSTGQFGEALQQAAAGAEVFQRNAASFAQLSAGLDQIKGKISSLFAGIAEGAAPGIQAIENAINSINFSGLGEQLGKIFPAVTEAFKEGKLAELVGEAFLTGLSVAWQALIRLVPASFEGLGTFLIKAFEEPLEYLQAGMTWVIEQAMEKWDGLKEVFHDILRLLYEGFTEVVEHFKQALGRIPKLGKMLGLDGYQPKSGSDIGKEFDQRFPAATRFKADSFQDILADRKAQGLKFNLGSGEYGTADMWSNTKDNLHDAFHQMGNAGQPFLNVVNGLAAKGPASPAGSGTAPSAGGNALTAGKITARPGLDGLEKIGAAARSGTDNPGLDAARRTADNTQKMTGQLALIAAALGGGGKPAGGNQL